MFSDDHVRLFGELHEDLLALLALEIERDAALVAVQVLEVEAVPVARRRVTIGAGRRLLDPYHLGAPIGQMAHAGRAGAMRREVDDLETGEGKSSFGHGLILRRTGKSGGHHPAIAGGSFLSRQLSDFSAARRDARRRSSAMGMRSRKDRNSEASEGFVGEWRPVTGLSRSRKNAEDPDVDCPDHFRNRTAGRSRDLQGHLLIRGPSDQDGVSNLTAAMTAPGPSRCTQMARPLPGGGAATRSGPAAGRANGANSVTTLKSASCRSAFSPRST